MADLRKTIAQVASPFKKPPAPLPAQGLLREEDEYGSEGSSSASSMSSTGTIVPTQPFQRRKRPPSSWHEYFEQELYLDHTEGSTQAKYHIYLIAPTNPAKDIVFVCHHGAGASGLSFALLARELRKRLPGCGVLSVEARDHGSVVGDSYFPLESDLSIEALSVDLLNMIHLTVTRMSWPQPPNMILVGHSLGGAVVTRVARDGSLGSRLLGFAVIDVVEGSAMEALKSMQSYLATRPASFASVEDAIDWHVRSRTIRNAESSRVSTPPLLRQLEDESWTWRTDLTATATYWENWFTGLSSSFLSGKAAKLLILAGTDRLDKDLMIGQMQGKFQLQVFTEAGHFVQEDLPERTADVLVEFYRRNDRSALVLPPKVSELLAQGKKV